MDADRPISELVDLLDRRHASPDPRQVLKELQDELELLIQRHHIEISLRTEEAR